MSRDFVYSDLDKDLKIQPDGNIRILYDEDAIRQSLKTIMATATGERVRSTFGGSLLPLLFEPMDEYLEDTIRIEIERVITQNEPRVRVQGILVRANPDNNSIDVQINVRIKRINRPVRFNTRLRSFAG